MWFLDRICQNPSPPKLSTTSPSKHNVTTNQHTFPEFFISNLAQHRIIVLFLPSRKCPPVFPARSLVMGVLPGAGSTGLHQLQRAGSSTSPFGKGHNGTLGAFENAGSPEHFFFVDNLAFAIPLGVCLSTLSLLTFLGNAMVVHAIRTERKLHTVSLYNVDGLFSQFCSGKTKERRRQRGEGKTVQ